MFKGLKQYGCRYGYIFVFIMTCFPFCLIQMCCFTYINNGPVWVFWFVFWVTRQPLISCAAQSVVLVLVDAFVVLKISSILL